MLNQHSSTFTRDLSIKFEATQRGHDADKRPYFQFPATSGRGLAGWGLYRGCIVRFLAASSGAVNVLFQVCLLGVSL